MAVTRVHFRKAEKGLNAQKHNVHHFEVHPKTILPAQAATMESGPTKEKRPENMKDYAALAASSRISAAVGDSARKLYRNGAVPVDVVRAVSQFGKWFDSYQTKHMAIEVQSGPIKTVTI